MTRGLYLIRILQGLAAVMLLGLALVVGISIWLMYRHDYRLLAVQTGSMAPTLRVEDGVLSRPAQADKLTVGSLVTYRTSAGDLVTHRITGRDHVAGTLTTKGDANPSDDSPVAVDRVVSQPFATVPHAGFVIDLFRRPMVFLGLLYGLTIGLIGQEMIRYARTNRPSYRMPGY